MTTGPDYDGPVYVGPEGDEPELVDADVPDVDELLRADLIASLPDVPEREELADSLMAEARRVGAALRDQGVDADVDEGPVPAAGEREADGRDERLCSNCAHWSAAHSLRAGRPCLWCKCAAFAPRPAPAVPSPAAGEREAVMEEALRKSAIRLTSPEWEGPDDPQVFELRVADLLTALWDGDGLDEAVADLAATILADPPAVPVGVQPEPAEERCDCAFHWPGGHGAMPGGETSESWHVPVVHSDFAAGKVNPEPGDRAAKWRAVLKASGDGWWTPEVFMAALMALADVEVAAAVAAVRADTADEWMAGRWWRVVAADGSLWCESSDEQENREAMRPGDRLERLYDTVQRHEWRPAAAAVRSATKEGLG